MDKINSDNAQLEICAALNHLNLAGQAINYNNPSQHASTVMIKLKNARKLCYKALELLQSQENE